MAALLPLIAQLTIAVSAPDTVGLVEPIVLTVEITSTTSRSPRLVSPDFRDFTITGTTSSAYTQHDGVTSRTRVEFRYVLEAPGPGVYVLAPFEARAGAESARSTPTRIVVRNASATASAPPVVTKSGFDASAPVAVTAAVIPDTVFVGEQSTYQVAVFIDEAVRHRLRRNPGFTPPELRGMLAYDLSPLRSNLPARRIGQRRFEPHLYQRAVFPLVPGRHVIPPAELRYSLPLSYSFFSREESHVLHTDSLVLVVRDLPADGRPPDWDGAVGEYRVAASVDTAAVRVGDPSVLTLTVTGRGNIKMLPRPAIEVPWAALIPAQERVRLAGEAEQVSGTKEFDWVLTPQTDGPQELPPLRFPFFNPRTEQYEIALSPAVALSVAPGTLLPTTPADSQAIPLLPLRPRLEDPPLPPLQSGRGFWLLLASAPIPALVAAFVRRPRKPRAPNPAATLRALRRGRRSGVAPAEIRRAYVNALAQRLHLPPGTLATRLDFARALRLSGVSREASDAAAALLADLDDAAYGMRPSEVAALVDRATQSYTAVDAEARTGGSAVRGGTALMLLLLALAPTIEAQSRSITPEVRELFAQGRSLYQARRFPEAALAFGRVTTLEPDAADAWANLGTAAWMAGDTATAVVGWQRALRLEPLARDVRVRLRQVSSSRLDSPAWVPPIPPRALAFVALALWMGACALACVHAMRRRRVMSPSVLLPSLAAALLLGGGELLDERLAARSLVVVGEAAHLRALPALSGAAIATVHPGDVARTIARRGEWALVRDEHGREGWIEGPLLISLARD